LEANNHQNLARVLRLAEALTIRKASIEEFYQSYQFSNTTNISANLAWVDYRRLKDQIWDGDFDDLEQISESRFQDTPPTAFTRTGSWDDHHILCRVHAVMRKKLKHDTASAAVRVWWDDLLTRYYPKVLLRIVEELSVRQLDTARLHMACEEAGTTNIPALLAYIDCGVYKKEERLRALKHAEAGYKHYVEGRFIDAIDCYERAVREQPDVEDYYARLAEACEQSLGWSSTAGIQQAIRVLERGFAKCRKRFNLAL